MVVSLKAQGLWLAIARRSPIQTQRSGSPYWWASPFIRVGLSAGLLTAIVGLSGPAQASYSVGDKTVGDKNIETSVVPQLPMLTAAQKPDQLGKVTAQFEQTRFERDRQQQARLEAAQAEYARLERLRLLQAQIRPRNEQPQLEASPALQRPAASFSADGVYLYGQQPVPDQLETAYFVFEAQAGSITGAFYMPSSSFDCAQGHVSNEQIVLNITNSDSQETYRHALALDTDTSDVASRQGTVAAPLDIAGFHQLPVSDHDRSILATCQAL